MKTLNLMGCLLCTLLLASFAAAQSSYSTAKTVISSPAFVVLASQKATVASELNTLKSRYTVNHPDVIRKQHELDITQLEMGRLLSVSQDRTSMLSEAYGQLIVRKIKAEMNLLDLLDRNTLTHPLVLEAANQLQAIENELAGIR